MEDERVLARSRRARRSLDRAGSTVEKEEPKNTTLPHRWWEGMT